MRHSSLHVDAFCSCTSTSSDEPIRRVRSMNPTRRGLVGPCRCRHSAMKRCRSLHVNAFCSCTELCESKINRTTSHPHHKHLHDVQHTAMHDDGISTSSYKPLLDLVIEFPMQSQFPACRHPNHRSSVLAPNSVSQNMNDDDFAHGLGINDDDDKMN